MNGQTATREKPMSPSPRRAWIEMISGQSFPFLNIVALPTEGVD